MTNSDSFSPVHDSSSSRPTVALARYEAALELGRRLTKELDLDQSVDTLGRWMAHYIAELICESEKASGEEQTAKMRTCSDAILALWKHRYELSGKHPFELLEPILRAVASLDPADDTPRYFRSIRHSIDNAEDKDNPNSWLKLIDGLDYAARSLIRYFLVQAAQGALDKSLEWVALAEAAGAEDELELPVVRLIAGESNLLEEPDPGEATKKELESRIARLEGFIEMGTALVSELRRQLQHLPRGR